MQCSVASVEMAICWCYWKQSPVEREQVGNVPPPWERGTGTLAS